MALRPRPSRGPGSRVIVVLTFAVLVAVVLGALAQAVGGLGFALVCGPLLVGLLGPFQGVRLSVALSLVLNLLLLIRLRRDVDRRAATLLLVPSVLATPVFARLARVLPERPAAALAGGVVLLGTLLLAGGLRWPAAGGRAGMVAGSLLAAGTNVIAGVGGPPVALWAENAGWAAAPQRATLQAYFLGTNAVAVAFLGLPTVGADVLLSCLAALLVGALLGPVALRRITEMTARRITLTLAAAGGAWVLLTALVG